MSRGSAAVADQEQSTERWRITVTNFPNCRVEMHLNPEAYEPDDR
jgi:hypothetical protein